MKTKGLEQKQARMKLEIAESRAKAWSQARIRYTGHNPERLATETETPVFKTIQAILAEWDADRSAEARKKYRARMRVALKDRNNPGFVYLIGSTEIGRYKIGLTRDKTPDTRINTVASYLPFEVDHIRYWAVKDCHVTESRLHRKFAPVKIPGKREWFKFRLDQLETVAEQIAEMASRDKRITSLVAN